MAIVFIGPWCSGKTTWAKRYAQWAGKDFIDLDEVAPEYGREIGWSIDWLISRNKEVGMLASEIEWESHRAYFVERVISDFPDAVIALGAAYTGYTSGGLQTRVSEVLSAHSAVLLTPSCDTNRSREVSVKRALESRGEAWVNARHKMTSWTPTELDRNVAKAVVTTEFGFKVSPPIDSNLLVELHSFSLDT